MATSAPGPTRADGVVVLLFTDVVGSTRLLDRLGDDANEELRRTHFALLREAVGATRGREVKSLGDGLMVAFASPVEALRCAVEMQRAVAAHNQQDPTRAVEIRVGLHLGDPPRDDDDFFGTAVVVARRLCDRAAGGQILVSELLAGVAGPRAGYRFRRLGRLHLKGLAEPVAAMAVEWERPALGRAESVAPAPRQSRAPTAHGPRLVGREDELAVLNSEWARASAGEFRCVLLLGDAGMGKTRLAAELLDGPAADAVALPARAYPFGQTASFGLWSEALERHLRRLAVHEIVELCGGFLDDLAGLLRSVAAARGAAPEGDAPTLRLMDGLAALLTNLALAGPIVVSFDDVHLADPSSWEALHYLAHTLSDIPVLVIACARPAELAEHPSARQVVGALEQDGQLRRLVLPPVGRADLAELCQSVVQVPPPEPLVRWVAEGSQGNPLFALGLVRALMDEGGDLTAPRLHRLPETLTDRVASRLADLDVDAVGAVEVFAVLARPLRLQELALFGGGSIDETAGVVHRLIRARLVTADDDEIEARYELAHPLLQEVVYQRIAVARRRTLHRLAARSLLGSGRVAEAAPHFARGADVGDPEAVDALRDALREAEERRAYLEALDILTTLVHLLPAGDDRWAEVIDALAPEARWAPEDDRVDLRTEVGAARGLEAMRFLESVVERSPDLARRAAIKYRLARFLGWGMGDFPEAIRLAREARDLYEAVGDQRSMLVTSGRIAHLCAMAGEWDALAAEAARALQAGETLGEPLLLGGVMTALARNAVWQGHFDEADAFIERLVAVARDQGDSDQLTWILGVAAICRVFEGRVSEVGPILAEVKSLPQAWRRSFLVAWEPGFHWLAGDVGRGQVCAEEFLASHPDGLSPRRAIGAVFSALLAVEADRPGEAEDYVARAAAAFGERGWAFFDLTVGHAAAVLAWRQCRREEALAQVREAARKLLGSKGVIFGALALVDQAELAADAADREAAGEAAAHLDEIADVTGRDLYRGYAAFGRACAELAAGDTGGGAAGPAEEAVAVFSSLGYRLFEGRALVLLGRARSRSNRAGALEAFERAAAVFEAGGAIWRRDRTRALMRALGGRGRKVAAAGSGPGALTRREREVAQLAARGHTARQIAEALFVGERTIEAHLASVYSKLGISSKVDLARRADQLGL
jgi:class 3 adenylate cyclase/DNA-binding CsgD family transcriptional regulator